MTKRTLLVVQSIPIKGLDEKEFLYCAYTLAVEADRLEYLIRQSDEH